MESPSISTVVGSIVGVLAVLTPLIKAISHWHIECKKMSAKEKSAQALQNQTSQSERSMRFFRMAALINGFICGLLGMYLLYQQTKAAGPVTEASLATTVLAVIYFYLGWIKKQPWE